MTISELLNEGATKLENSNIPNHFAESRLILSHVLKKDKEWLMTYPEVEVEPSLCKVYNGLIMQRCRREPLQYILGYQDFMGYRFLVDKNVLIPRADTEILVESAYHTIKDIKEPKILDLCTGSGCIGISLKRLLPNAIVCASDIEQSALCLAQKNAEINDVDIVFIHSNLFNDISVKDFDIIVSNPPYIKTGDFESLQEEVLREPKIALNGGEDGLRFYREIADKSRDYLRPGATIQLEIGHDQTLEVKRILEENGFEDVRVIKDYSGNYRVMLGVF